MLTSALEHDARQKAIARRTLLAARAGRFGGLSALVGTIAQGQQEAAFTALAAVPRMLAEQGIDPDADAETQVRSLTYVSSDGRSLDGLMDYTRSPEVTRTEFDRIVLTQLSDVARLSSAVGSAVRPAVTGYVRMLEGGSCSRCVILAGKFYRTNTGFQRHPKCDCRHIPSRENLAGDVTTDPAAYFDSLSPGEQARTFTTAGAEAIREGADIAKVVNARRGMSTAQTVTGRRRMVRRDVFGRPLYVTTEAGKKGLVRLMPESIIELAGGDRRELLRLLKSHGYIE